MNGECDRSSDLLFGVKRAIKFILENSCDSPKSMAKHFVSIALELGIELNYKCKPFWEQSEN